MTRISRSLPLVVCLLLPAAAAAADLHFPEPAADAGEVRSGTSLVRRFAFVNQGRGPVELVEVRAGCGCLTPRLEAGGALPRTYRPGEGGAVVLEVNTLTQPAGLQTWPAMVVYQAGGQRHEVALQIAARVVTEVTVRPPILILSTDSAIEHEIVLLDLRPQPLLVRDVRPSSPELRAHLGEPGRDAEGHWARRIKVEVGSDYPEGRRDEVLSIVTDDPMYRELRVPVTVVKRPRQRVTASPAEVVFRAAAGQPVPSQTVRVRDADNRAVVVDRVEADDPALVCTWAPGPGAMATVKLRADRAAGGRLQTTVRVHLSKPEVQTLTIPVTGDWQ